jgi:acyl-CoA synthetase (AMP-forming)/AMP-acid ligase II
MRGGDPCLRARELGEGSVVRAVAARAASAPGAPALAWLARGGVAEQVWSYAEVWRRAGRRSALLRRRPARFVVVALSEGVELLVSQLAVLRAGRVYVPLDVGDPRAAAMLADLAGGWVALLEQPCDSVVPAGQALLLDDLAADEAALGAAEVSADDDEAPVSPDALAMCFFTSGSTGAPKGVLVKVSCLVRSLACVASGPLDSARARKLTVLGRYSLLARFRASLSRCSMRVLPHSRVPRCCARVSAQARGFLSPRRSHLTHNSVTHSRRSSPARWSAARLVRW